jgi:hypothetical protein
MRFIPGDRVLVCTYTGYPEYAGTVVDSTDCGRYAKVRWFLLFTVWIETERLRLLRKRTVQGSTVALP